MERSHERPWSCGLVRDPLLTRFAQGSQHNLQCVVCAIFKQEHLRIRQKIHCFWIVTQIATFVVFFSISLYANYTVLSILCLDGMRGPIWHYFRDDDVPNALSHLLLNANAWSLLGLPYLIILVRTYPSGNSPLSFAFGIFSFWGWWCSFSVWWDMMIVPWKASCFNSNSNSNNNNMPYNFENNPTRTTGQSTCNCQSII